MHPKCIPKCTKGGPPIGWTAPRGGTVRQASLEGDGGPGALEGVLGLVRSVLGDLLQDRLRRGLHQLLGLLQAERGEGAHLLDDVDLLLAGSLEDDVELVLRGGLLGAPGRGTAGGG